MYNDPDRFDHCTGIKTVLVMLIVTNDALIYAEFRTIFLFLHKP